MNFNEPIRILNIARYEIESKIERINNSDQTIIGEDFVQIRRQLERNSSEISRAIQVLENYK